MKNLFFALSAVFALSTSFYLQPDFKLSDKAYSSGADTALVADKPVISENISSSLSLYESLDFQGNSLNPEIFDTAYRGFQNLKKSGKLNAESHLLTVCDFSLSSNKKRMWIIDLAAKKILFNSLVAHGQGTGEEFAEKFSNTESSHQSSLGFFITESTYEGSNGYSLKLEGMDKGYNDAAMQRAIVMHGADYVSEDFAKQHKRIGRSWGCPAVPRELAETIINTIKQKNVLFIYYPDQSYLNSSEWLKS